MQIINVIHNATCNVHVLVRRLDSTSTHRVTTYLLSTMTVLPHTFVYCSSRCKIISKHFSFQLYHTEKSCGAVPAVENAVAVVQSTFIGGASFIQCRPGYRFLSGLELISIVCAHTTEGHEWNTTGISNCYRMYITLHIYTCANDKTKSIEY